ncbi:hypothetical protein Lal_00015445 [Lupinus albus]|nr:hypothetical protein Lal_00015445 [Lupinus albus]
MFVFKSVSDNANTLQSDDPSVEESLSEKITNLTSELEKLNPNMRAMERLESVESRLRVTDQEYEDSKTAAHEAKEEQISHVYKDLTRSEAYPLGGQAYLDIEEDTDMPYLSGIKYHAMPPLKRFRDMEHLSGGEKTMAALALLFAIHSYQPSPFFVLDEVDAALDNANVDKIKKYIKDHRGPDYFNLHRDQIAPSLDCYLRDYCRLKLFLYLVLAYESYHRQCLARLRDDDLAYLMSTNTKELHKICGKLREDRFLVVMDGDGGPGQRWPGRILMPPLLSCSDLRGRPDIDWARAVNATQ